MLAAISMDRYVIYDKLRFEGSVYPILALIFGPGLFIVAQHVTNRAGVATFTVLLGFILAGLVMVIVKNIFGFPKAASLPIMALVGALLLDLAFKRFGHGYKMALGVWTLFCPGVLCNRIFVGMVSHPLSVVAHSRYIADDSAWHCYRHREHVNRCVARQPPRARRIHQTLQRQMNKEKDCEHSR